MNLGHLPLPGEMELIKLAQRDATVQSYLRFYYRGEMSWTEMISRLAVILANQKGAAQAQVARTVPHHPTIDWIIEELEGHMGGNTV